MKSDFREMFSRIATAGLFILLGIGLCWRGYSFNGPAEPSVVAPVLCILLGMLLVITGATVAMRGGEFEAEKGEQEVRPYGN